jgi:hypothetical protein
LIFHGLIFHGWIFHGWIFHGWIFHGLNFHGLILMNGFFMDSFPMDKSMVWMGWWENGWIQMIRYIWMKIQLMDLSMGEKVNPWCVWDDEKMDESKW